MGGVRLLEVILLLVVIGLVVIGTARAVGRFGRRPPLVSARGAQWKVTHYDAKGATRVVVQKVSPGGANLLSEHVVATIRLDEPDYDAHFMTAMATARERRAMFEVEGD